jgi:hypothetical protein
MNISKNFYIHQQNIFSYIFCYNVIFLGYLYGNETCSHVWLDHDGAVVPAAAIEFFVERIH